MLHKDFSFIGRTYASNGISLKFDRGVYSSTTTDYLYVYTSYDPSTIEIAVDLIVYEIVPPDSPIKQSMFSAGWTTFPVLKGNKSMTQNVYEGSVRLLLLKNCKSKAL